MNTGPLAKYPVTKIKVKLFDGGYHDVDSSEMAFKIAASQAMKLAMTDASPVLLEPIMTVHIYVPEDFTGAIMNDLTGKRGKILGMEKISKVTQEIRAEVPLSEMLTYCIDLKAITSGKGTFEMALAYYKELTGPASDKVIQARQKAMEKQNA
jgi:elongation factor G